VAFDYHFPAKLLTVNYLLP